MEDDNYPQDGHSLLTNSLRKFLIEDDHSKRSDADVSQKRSAIPRRLRDALLDCGYLLDNLQEVQLDKILNPVEGDVSERDVLDLRMDRAALSSVVGLVWLLCQRYDRTTSFANVAGLGIEKAMLAEGTDADVFVEIETYDPEPVHRVADRALSKDPTDFRNMTGRELDALARVGELTADEYERAVDARFDALRDEGLFDHDEADGENR